MSSDEFARVVKARRAVRRFKPDPVPDEYIDKILDTARWAPSGANSQPWEFIVVKDPEMRRKITELHGQLDGTRTRLWESTRREDLRHWAALAPAGRTSGAPVIIVPIGDMRASYASVVAVHIMYSDRNLENMTNVTLLLHLAAASLGLAAQWMTIEKPSMGPFKSLLGIPEIYEIFSMVPIGYPAYEPRQTYRKELNDLVHADKYDMSRYRADEQVIEDMVTLRKLTRRGYIPDSTS